MSKVTDLYGSMVFNEHVMRESACRRPPTSSLHEDHQGGRAAATMDVANVVAHAMKDWAIEKGATHYTHWFQPLTGITAEKHDSFITPTGDGERHHGVFRQGAHQGRARRLQLPLRRPARHL